MPLHQRIFKALLALFIFAAISTQAFALTVKKDGVVQDNIHTLKVGAGLNVSTDGGESLLTASQYAADTASTDTYVIAPSPAFTAYATGMRIVFKAVTANTGACTVNVNGLGAKNLLSLNDVTPPDNYIEAGSIVVAIYDGTSFQMIQPDANP